MTSNRVKRKICFYCVSKYFSFSGEENYEEDGDEYIVRAVFFYFSFSFLSWLLPALEV